MSVDTITASAMSAEGLAHSLNHWQVLDIVHIARNGPMQVGAARPWKPLNDLIAFGILKYAGGAGKHINLVPGPRFISVLYALERAGRIAKHERAAP